MPAIVVHGGAGGTSPRARRGVARAGEVGARILRQGGSALEAAVAAVVWMENSGIFNAGVGSILRIDGTTIEMDAAVATSTGLQGGVGAVRGIKNPVLMALRIAEAGSARFFSGEGATSAARRLGLEPHPGPSEQVLARWRAMMAAIERGEIKAPPPGWRSEEVDLRWSDQENGANQTVPTDHDTVGAIALDSQGTFAVASSTGGSGAMAVGRVGDVPFEGDGYQTGNRGAVLATGIGEKIRQLHGSRLVYQRIQGGLHPQAACEAAVQLFPPDVNVGFIALTRQGVGVDANCPMARHAIEE